MTNLSPRDQLINHIREDVHADIGHCLRGGHDFMGYSNNGRLSSWSPYELWEVLTYDVDEHDIAKMLFAVLNYDATNHKSQEIIVNLKEKLEIPLGDFVEEQVRWRLSDRSEDRERLVA